VNIVTAIFNIPTGQMTEMSQRKKQGATASRLCNQQSTLTTPFKGFMLFQNYLSLNRIISFMY